MSTYKLTYFNLRGRAEVSRLIFVAAGQEFEDVRIERDQWPTIKPTAPLGQLPVLEVDGVQIPQSVAIARFLAKKFNLAGKTDVEQAQADVVVDTVGDLIAAYVPVRREQDENKKKELLDKFLAEDLPKQLGNLETLGKLYSNGGQFFVGDSLTWADLAVYSFSENFVAKDPNSLEAYPFLKANRTAVDQQPRIAEYLKVRPKTEI